MRHTRSTRGAMAWAVVSGGYSTVNRGICVHKRQSEDQFERGNEAWDTNGQTWRAMCCRHLQLSVECEMSHSVCRYCFLCAVGHNRERHEQTARYTATSSAPLADGQHFQDQAEALDDTQPDLQRIAIAIAQHRAKSVVVWQDKARQAARQEARSCLVQVLEEEIERRQQKLLRQLRLQNLHGRMD